MKPFVFLFFAVVAVEGDSIYELIVSGGKNVPRDDVIKAVKLLGDLQKGMDPGQRKIAAWNDKRMVTVGPGNLDLVYCEAALIGGENSDAAVIEKRCGRSLQQYAKGLGVIQYKQGDWRPLLSVACEHVLGGMPIPGFYYPRSPDNGNAAFVKIDTKFDGKSHPSATKFIGCQ